MVYKRFPDNPLLASDGSQRFLALAILLTRLIPVFSFALISYAAGVTAIYAWRFALATFIGMLPMTVVFAGLGNTFTLNPVLTVVAGLAILAVMVWLPWFISRRPKSRLARWLNLHQ
ncbi:VTT domain-containing protein [Halomonas sp. SpR1]|uniref:TVP38/TMEM64 family protein n=1 Tax=Halomonas sp. SpR1 TaxID=3050462 RepID=UPI0027E53E2C|nr:VTT domain-containing protein [Halomonas sp. SpR1]MDQ7732177.1 VTT domain-containing protein [Halomonas sp. SpR1]